VDERAGLLLVARGRARAVDDRRDAGHGGVHAVAGREVGRDVLDARGRGPWDATAQHAHRVPRVAQPRDDAAPERPGPAGHQQGSVHDGLLLLVHVPGSSGHVRGVPRVYRSDTADQRNVTMSDETWLTARFEEQRPRLRGVAYRMLGSASEADDAVQEAWLRLHRTGADDVENLQAWLTTVVARVCLNMLRSRDRPREAPLGEPDADAPRGGDPLLAPATGVDPEQEAVLADSVGLALLVVLDTLAPAERLAFVLHDMFDLPFDEIAPVVARPTEATRQLASRPRRRARGREPHDDAALPRRRLRGARRGARAGGRAAGRRRRPALGPARRDPRRARRRAGRPRVRAACAADGGRARGRRARARHGPRRPPGRRAAPHGRRGPGRRDRRRRRPRPARPPRPRAPRAVTAAPPSTGSLSLSAG